MAIGLGIRGWRMWLLTPSQWVNNRRLLIGTSKITRRWNVDRYYIRTRLWWHIERHCSGNDDQQRKFYKNHKKHRRFEPNWNRMLYGCMSFDSNNIENIELVIAKNDLHAYCLASMSILKSPSIKSNIPVKDYNKVLKKMEEIIMWLISNKSFK